MYVLYYSQACSSHPHFLFKERAREKTRNKKKEEAYTICYIQTNMRVTTIPWRKKNCDEEEEERYTLSSDVSTFEQLNEKQTQSKRHHKETKTTS